MVFKQSHWRLRCYSAKCDHGLLCLSAECTSCERFSLEVKCFPEDTFQVQVHFYSRLKHAYSLKQSLILMSLFWVIKTGMSDHFKLLQNQIKTCLCRFNSKTRWDRNIRSELNSDGCVCVCVCFIFLLHLISFEPFWYESYRLNLSY